MRNITVSVEEVGSETLLERRRRLLREVVADFEAQGVGLRSIDNLSRDELYDRDRAKAETGRRLVVMAGRSPSN
ncbi:MAG: hypothetical protein F4Y45_05480 [Acidobacteria bacterium]|nr:hypothetical protein [Acidobacteriota bacterium]MYJ04564.1 hypothetical protein [Acidobacteriota bacterium]